MRTMYESQNDYLRNTPDGWEPSDSILQKKICKMIEDTYPILRNFPKVERYGMTADIKRIMDSMVELTIDADNHHRKTALEKLDIANKKLKKYIRLAFRLQFIAPRNYKRWSEMTTEIGRIIHGRITGSQASTRTR